MRKIREENIDIVRSVNLEDCCIHIFRASEVLRL